MNDIAAECFLFFVGGFETAAAAISWAIYELALNQNLQKKTRSEIHRVLAKHGGKITYEGVQELTYLDRVIAGKFFFSPINLHEKLFQRISAEVSSRASVVTKIQRTVQSP